MQPLLLEDREGVASLRHRRSSWRAASCRRCARRPSWEAPDGAEAEGERGADEHPDADRQRDDEPHKQLWSLPDLGEKAGGGVRNHGPDVSSATAVPANWPASGVDLTLKSNGTRSLGDGVECKNVLRVVCTATCGQRDAAWFSSRVLATLRPPGELNMNWIAVIVASFVLLSVIGRRPGIQRVHQQGRRVPRDLPRAADHFHHHLQVGIRS